MGQKHRKITTVTVPAYGAPLFNLVSELDRIRRLNPDALVTDCIILVDNVADESGPV